MPLFYNQLKPLSLQAHGGLRINPGKSVKFAAASNSIPVMADEFFVAQAHYPIVFTAGPQPAAVMVVGLQNGRNLFVTEGGGWRSDNYVPAYVRRYPFALANVGGSDNLVLAVDDTADILSSTEGAPLFENGQPSPIVQRALQFCGNVQRQFDIAQQFAAAVVGANLLTDKQVEVRSANRPTPYVFSGFGIIDEQRFNALPDAVYLDWRKRGWIALAYAHLMSLQRWRALAALAGAQGAWDELLTEPKT